MIKIKAFLTALALFLGIVSVLHFFTEYHVEQKGGTLGTWTDEAKYASAETMARSMDDTTVLVMGSSELQHQKKTPYHPANLFGEQDFSLMLVGAGYYQSLYHATLLAAMDKVLSGDQKEAAAGMEKAGLQGRKAVLILAPQWFRKTGVKPEAYSSRFSEENFLNMLQNTRISGDTKAYIMERTKKLLSVDPATRERVIRYEERYLKGEPDAFGDFKSDLYQMFLKEKNRTNIALRHSAYNLLAQKPDLSFSSENQEMSRKAGEESVPSPDFEKLRNEAAADGEKAWGGNPFYVSRRYYENYIVKVMDEVKDEGINTGYSVSPEFEDFECFLTVCRELGIRPLVVIAPVNGYWYDYIGFPQDAREDYYSQVRELILQYDAVMADFSGREYEEFFMEDTVHVGWKGWVDICEEIYRYEKS